MKYILKSFCNTHTQKCVAIDPTCIYIERLQRSANDKNAVKYERLQRTQKGMNVF